MNPLVRVLFFVVDQLYWIAPIFLCLYICFSITQFLHSTNPPPDLFSYVFPSDRNSPACDAFTWIILFLFTGAAESFFGPLSRRWKRAVVVTSLFEGMRSAVTVCIAIAKDWNLYRSGAARGLFVSGLRSLVFPLAARIAAVRGRRSITLELLQNPDPRVVRDLITSLLVLLGFVHLWWVIPQLSLLLVRNGQAVIIVFRTVGDIVVGIALGVVRQQAPDLPTSVFVGGLFWVNVVEAVLSVLTAFLLGDIFHGVFSGIRLIYSFACCDVWHERCTLIASIPVAEAQGVCAECDRQLCGTTKQLPCGHLFHEACLYELPLGDSKCPVCGERFDTPPPPRTWETVKERWRELAPDRWEDLSQAVDTVVGRMGFGNDPPDDNVLDQQVLPYVLDELKPEIEEKEIDTPDLPELLAILRQKTETLQSEIQRIIDPVEI
jgi:hypothetical protein